MINELISKAVAGCKTVAAPIECLGKLQHELSDLEKGDYHTGYIDSYSGKRDMLYPTDLDFEARTVIVAAAPSPIQGVKFTYEGIAYTTILPPTYYDYYEHDASILSALNNALSPRGYKTASANRLPLKLLAVQTGLGVYGRNNICYVDGFGSHVSLHAYFSDIDHREIMSDGADFHGFHGIKGKIARADRCDNCGICVSACPVKAIDPKRRIINADICLTSLNEHKGEFPDWLDKRSHNSIVGCMKCQEACPMNNQDYHINVAMEFNEDETLAILKHTSGEEYPVEIDEKIKSIGIYYYRDLLPRNLEALLSALKSAN